MTEAEHMTDLVEQDGEQVDACRWRAVEFGILGRRRVNEPAKPAGVSIDGNRRTDSLRQGITSQISNIKFNR